MFIQMEPIDDHNEPCSAKKIKAMSPGNIPFPSGGGGSWDAVMSPFAPDMNSIASGSYMPGYSGNGNHSSLSSHSNNLTRSSSFDFGGSDILSMNDSINPLDALNSMEKTINEQVGGMPAPPLRNSCDGSSSLSQFNSSLGQSHNQNPHTPQTGPHTPHTPQGNGPPSVGQNMNHCTPPNHNNSSNSECGSTLPDTTTNDTGLPSDLNFDPEAVINGEGSGNESLNVSPF